MKKIWQKLTVSGSIIMVVEYEKPIQTHYSKKSLPPQKTEGTIKPCEEEIQKKCDRRAAHKIERIINSFFYLKKEKAFFTLTYHRKQENRSETRDHLGSLFKSLKRETKNSISWLALTELQERGAIHVHGIMDKFIPFEDFLDTWQKASGDDGGCWLEKCRENTNLGTYITKYLFKSPEKQGRKKGERRYWKSRDVKDLTIVCEFQMPHDWDRLKQSMEHLYEFEYDTEFNGKASGFQGSYHNPGEILDVAWSLAREGF